MICRPVLYLLRFFVQNVSNDLVAMQVQKIDVNYDKTSKQVDVRILKETLWSRLQHIQNAPEIVSGSLLYDMHLLLVV